MRDRILGNRVHRPQVQERELIPTCNLWSMQLQYLPCSSVKSESGGWILVTVVMVTVVMVTVVMVIVRVGVSRGRHTVSVISHQAFVQARLFPIFLKDNTAP